MRFGQVQTDKVYNRLIKPTVKRLKIALIRIDRVEHNDNIDQRIIRELELCDLAIADLTFARPSVYFEAGYAQRKVPVIYTSRRDHLKPHDSDRYGNFSVHFDLQMKNIIAWRSEKDVEFARRLKVRIKKVVRPILLEKAKREAADRFSRLSIQNRVQTIRVIGSQELLALDFRQTVIKPSYYPSAALFANGATVVSLIVSDIAKAGLKWEYRSVRNALSDFEDQYSRKGKILSPVHVTANWILCTF
jgi:nucleoside 2-deoxyribosyltransferase